MNDWMNDDNMRMTVCLSEDVGAPELRNPLNYGMYKGSWLMKIVRTIRG